MNHFFKISILSLLISCSSNNIEDAGLGDSIGTKNKSQQVRKEAKKNTRRISAGRNTRRIIAGEYELIESSSGLHINKSIKLRFRTYGPILESVNSPYCFDFKASLKRIDLNPTRVGSKYMGNIEFHRFLFPPHIDPETSQPLECNEAEQIFRDFIPFLMIKKFTYDTSNKRLTLLSRDSKTTLFIFNKIE
ncbi:hypothetical protein [Tenacibaculum sp. C7A-26P2]|uniref:hypothetical protein n=1 Tax=Tenacibaculum sp. C7A-26P2 TaxID=3447504 RepID=UPI003F857824